MGIMLLTCGSSAQQATSPPLRVPSSDIVVEGRRALKRLQGGEWVVRLSPSYRYGRPEEVGNGGYVIGRDRSWRFCLGDTDIEPLVRLLIGEGPLESSGTADCSRLKILLRDGKLTADQSCSGGTMQSAGISQGANTTVKSAQNTLRITGRYGPTKLQIDFDSQSAPVGYDPSYAVRPDGRRWSIRGERMGECPSPDAGSATAGEKPR